MVLLDLLWAKAREMHCNFLNETQWVILCKTHWENGREMHWAEARDRQWTFLREMLLDELGWWQRGVIKF